MEKISYIEAALDDPEHISLENYNEELIPYIAELKKELKKLIDSYDNGRVLYEAVKTVILGKPNAGKSSFLNSLIGEERAIVTEIEGTTRDTLEEAILINGISLNIIDTAGIRNTEDKVAELILYVVDSSRVLDENDKEILELIQGRKVIILYNKCDLEAMVMPEEIKSIIQAPVIKISAKKGEGIEEFEELLKTMFFEGKISINDEIFITNTRQKNDIASAYKSIEMVENSINMGMSEDLYTIDFMNAYESLGRVIGKSVEDDLVDTIFRKFCMGK